MSDDCAFWLDYSDGGPSPVLRYSAPIKMGWAPGTVVPPESEFIRWLKGLTHPEEDE